MISGLLFDLLVDVAEICKREEYWEELGIMETTYQTHGQMLVEKSKLEGKLEGKLKATPRK